MNIKIISSTHKLYNTYEIYLNKIIGKGSYSNIYMGRIIDKKIISEKSLTSDIIAIKKIQTNKMINDEIDVMQKIMKISNICNNIIKCIDVIEELNYIYIIMEYCIDGDLSNIIGEPIKENIVKYYFGQLVNALFYLNKNNIIHRDIKPKNILLKNNRKDLVLCDFGFARIKTVRRVKTICGSPLYMAPELLDEKTYTDIVDVWAIGMILYEMIYGKHPYKDCKDIDDLKEFSKKSIMIPPVHNTNINVSNDCIDLMKQLLEKEEKMRITLDKLFNHPWIKDFDYKNIDITILEDIEYSEFFEDSNYNENIEKSNSNNIKNDDFDTDMIFNLII